MENAEFIDLTKILDNNLTIYKEGTYADPPFCLETWATIPSQGYQVSRLLLGTQTGTHIDAPAHFVEEGATLEALPINSLMGKYIWLDLHQLVFNDLSKLNYQGESLLFLTSTAQREAEIAESIFNALLELPCRVWITAFSVQVLDCDPLYFHKTLAVSGRYLVENLDEISAARVRAGGEIFVLPLRLQGASGAPCRVVVKQPINSIA